MCKKRVINVTVTQEKTYNKNNESTNKPNDTNSKFIKKF